MHTHWTATATIAEQRQHERRARAARRHRTRNGRPSAQTLAATEPTGDGRA